MPKRNTGQRRRFPPAQPGMMPPEEWEGELVIIALLGRVRAPIWPDRGPGPHPFRGAGSRGKSYCWWCDLVGRGAGTCLQCGGPMIQMSKSWRPGRKGTRTRVWNTRVSRRHAEPARGWPNGHPVYVPDVVRQLGVKGLPPRRPASLPWWAADPVTYAIRQRGLAQRARRRRNRT